MEQKKKARQKKQALAPLRVDHHTNLFPAKPHEIPASNIPYTVSLLHVEQPNAVCRFLPGLGFYSSISCISGNPEFFNNTSKIHKLLLSPKRTSLDPCVEGIAHHAWKHIHELDYEYCSHVV